MLCTFQHPAREREAPPLHRIKTAYPHILTCANCPIHAIWACIRHDQALSGPKVRRHSRDSKTRAPSRGYRSRVGFLSRLLIPRSMSRAVHPGRAVKRAVTPRAIKRASRAMHPLSNAVYGVERSANTKRRSKSRSPVYHHGTCTVNHRSQEAAAKCRRAA